MVAMNSSANAVKNPTRVKNMNDRDTRTSGVIGSVGTSGSGTQHSDEERMNEIIGELLERTGPGSLLNDIQGARNLTETEQDLLGGRSIRLRKR